MVITRKRSGEKLQQKAWHSRKRRNSGVLASQKRKVKRESAFSREFFPDSELSFHSTDVSTSLSLYITRLTAG
jgi:hypothetical protein